MKNGCSLGNFRQQMQQHSRFELSCDDPCSPVSLTAVFKDVAVNLSASPYIVLTNDQCAMCLSHINAISQKECGDNATVFLLYCTHYTGSQSSTEQLFLLKCS